MGGGCRGSRGMPPRAATHGSGVPPPTPPQVQESADWQNYVNRVFDLFDSLHTGSLSRESLQRVLCSHGTASGDVNGSSSPANNGEDLDECPFDDVVPAALREADEDADGMISREEFLRFLAAAPGDELSFYESRRRRSGAGRRMGTESK